MNIFPRGFVSLVMFSVVFLARATEPKMQIRVQNDVSYLAPDRTEKLDLYLPAEPVAGKLSPALVWTSATLFSYWLIGLFSSAAALDVVAGGTVASVAAALLVVLVSVGAAVVSLFAVLAGVHAATATASSA